MNPENNNQTFTLKNSEAIQDINFQSNSSRQDVLDVSQLLPADGVNSSNLKQFVKVTANGVYIDSSGLGQFSKDSQVARFASGSPGLNAMVAVQVGDTSVIHFDWSATANTPLMDNITDEGSEQGNTIKGTNQADTLTGTAGADTLYGMHGNDVIEGGAGNDIYIGGGGADRYVLTDINAVVTLDFKSTRFEKDILDVSKLLPEGVDASNLKNYLSITENGVFIDTTGSGDFSEDNKVARFTDESVFSLNEIAVQIGGNVQVVFSIYAQAGVKLDGPEAFESDEVLASRFETLSNSVQTESDPASKIGRLESKQGEIFNFKVADHQVDMAFGGEGNELIDAAEVTQSTQAKDDKVADHKLWLYGREGTDTLQGNSDGVMLDGGKGDDRIIGGSGRNMLIGGSGEDEFVITLETTTDDDLRSDLLYDYTSIEGQRDLIDLQTILPASATADNIHSYVKVNNFGVFIDVNGSGRFDTANQLARFGEKADFDNLIRLRLADGSDIEMNLNEELLQQEGTGEVDYLRGGEGEDVLIGNAGDDTLDGDALSSKSSVDHLYGGEGNDKLYVDNLDLSQGTVDGGVGFDTVKLEGKSGESLNLNMASAKVERAFGNDSDDVLDGSGYTGADGFNKSTGEYEADTAQRLELFGKYGDDTLKGGSGNDYLDGGADDDIIAGGGGRDFMVGGSGSDTFVLSDDGEIDTIWDFSSQSDTIDLRAFLPTTPSLEVLGNYVHFDSKYAYFDSAGSSKFEYSTAIAKFGGASSMDGAVKIIVGDGDYFSQGNDGWAVAGSGPQDITISGAALAPEGTDDQLLTLSGSGFEALLDNGESAGHTLQGDDLARFDWSKLTLSVKQADGSYENVNLTQADIGAVRIYGDRLEVVLDSGAAKVLDNDGFGTYADDLMLSVNPEFVGSEFADRADLNALADSTVAVTTTGATILNVTADTADGTYGVGDEVLIRVRFSERVELQNYDGDSDPLLLMLNNQMPNGSDQLGANAVYVSGSGSREFVFRHTIGEGENIDDLNYREAGSLVFQSQITGVNGAATAVNVNNASFEADALTDGKWITATPSGWTHTGGGGVVVWNPGGSGTSAFEDGVKHGDNVINLKGGELSQTLETTFSTDQFYRLSVDIGNRYHDAGMGNYEVRLMAGDEVIGTSSAVNPAEGQFEKLTLEVDGRDFAKDFAGNDKPISIVIAHLSGVQINVDNVSFETVDLSSIANGAESTANLSLPDPDGLNSLAGTSAIVVNTTNDSGEVAEVADVTAGGTTLSDNGNFAVAVVNPDNVSSLNVTPGANDYVGTFTPVLSNTASGEGMQLVDWSFSVADADVDHLAEGQTLTQNYTVSVDDGNGGTVDKVISVNITGTNDVPTITEVTDVAGSIHESTSGNAFEMDGTEGSGQIDGLVTGGSMTIATWARYDNLDGFWSRIIDFGDGQAQHNIVIAHQRNTGNLVVNFFDSDNKPNQYMVKDFFTEGEWVHITATVDDTGFLTIYKNGTEVGSLQGSGAPAEKARTNNYIGKSNWAPDAPLDGAIDDLLIVNRDLSAAEVAKLHGARSLSEFVPNLSGDTYHGYQFEDGVASTVTDISGNNVPITLTGSANTATLTDTGSFTVTDVDTNDTLSVAVTPGSADYRGTFTPVVGNDGKVNWTFTVADSELDNLGPGQSVTQTYTVTVSDGNGASVDQVVTVTVNGALDKLVIDSVALAPEGADSQMLTLSGSGFRALLANGESEGQALQGSDLARFDWSQFTVKMKQPDGSIENVSLTQSDIGAVRIYGDRMEVVLATDTLQNNDGFSTYADDTSLSVSPSFFGAADRVKFNELTNANVKVTTNGATVVNVSADTADGNYGVGDEVLIRVRFSEKVELQNYDGDNNPLLLLLNDRLPAGADAIGANAKYVSGSGSREFVFRYTIAEGENIDDLNYREAGSLVFESQITGVNGPATAVTINNASFEADALTDGQWITATPSGWNHTGGGGVVVWNPGGSGTSAFEDGVKHGDNVVNLKGGELSQTLETTFSTDQFYRLSVDIGNRYQDAGMGNYEVRLMAGGEVIGTSSAVNPAEGQFEKLTLEVDGRDFANDFAGNDKPISIVIAHLSGVQINVDNVNFETVDLSSIANGAESTANLSLPDPDGLNSLAGTSAIIVDTLSNRAATTSEVDLNSTNEDTAIVITKAQLLANAADANGDTLTLNSLTLNNSGDGTLIDNGNDTWTFTPAANFNGQDVGFNYLINDGTVNTAGTAVIDVEAVADAPTFAINTSKHVISEEDFEGYATASGGWSAVSGGPGDWESSGAFEVHNRVGGASAYDGNQWLELDYKNSVQDFISYELDTSNGQPHVLEMAVRARPGSTTNGIEIYWGDNLLKTISPTADWSVQRIELPPTGDATKMLRVQEPGADNDAQGSWIDGIKLMQVRLEASDDPAYDYTISSLEDTVIPLDLGSVSSGGSETITTSLSGIPSGSVITDGTNTVRADGRAVDISGWNLSKLSLTPTLNLTADFTLTLSATATEANGDTATTSHTLRVNLLASNDVDTTAPELSSSLASGNDLMLSFSEAIAGTPTNGDFSVKVDGVDRAVTAVTTNGDSATVTFDGSGLTGGEQVVYSYSGSSLTDSSGNAVDAITDKTAGFSHTSENALQTLLGSTGDDVFIINHDSVTATGGDGADTFDFNANGSSEKPAELVITDFSVNDGDQLKLDDILVKENSSLDDYFHFKASGSDTVMEISTNADGDVTKRVTFKDTNLLSLGGNDNEIINNLINNNNLDYGDSSA